MTAIQANESILWFRLPQKKLYGVFLVGFLMFSSRSMNCLSRLHIAGGREDS